jgi:hypothetical protein
MVPTSAPDPCSCVPTSCFPSEPMKTAQAVGPLSYMPYTAAIFLCYLQIIKLIHYAAVSVEINRSVLFISLNTVCSSLPQNTVHVPGLL